MTQTPENTIKVKIIEPRPFWLGGRNYVAERTTFSRHNKGVGNVRDIFKYLA